MTGPNGQPRWVATVISDLSSRAAVSRVAARARTAGSLADGVSMVAEALYGASVRAQIRRGLESPEFTRALEREMAKRPSEGVLIVIKSWVVQTGAGPRHSDIVVYPGPAAPSMELALTWERDRAKIWPSHGAGRVAYDYLWLARSGHWRRPGPGAVPPDKCVISEVWFDNLHGR